MMLFCLSLNPLRPPFWPKSWETKRAGSGQSLPSFSCRSFVPQACENILKLRGCVKIHTQTAAGQNTQALGSTTKKCELKDHTVLPAWLTGLAQPWAEAACLSKGSALAPCPLMWKRPSEPPSLDGRPCDCSTWLMEDVSYRKHTLAHDHRMQAWQFDSKGFE